MKKIATTIDTLLIDLKDFYEPSIWNFITVNGVDLTDGMEIQYFFSKYNAYDEVVCFYMKVSYNQLIPTITSLIPSAYLGEGEIVDMFGVNVKDTPKGMFLEDDSVKHPLRKEI